MNASSTGTEPHARTRRKWGLVQIVRRTLLATIGLLVALYAVCVVVAITMDGSIRHTVTIKAPVEEVWEYGSDSTRARYWSVYFHHITPIEGKGRPRDGSVGALRICYRNKDESGPRWSETTEAVTPLRHREIRTFDLHGFQFAPLSSRISYTVHQNYRVVDTTTSTLEFSTKVERRPGIRGALAFPVLKSSFLLLGRAPGRQVFVWNLTNIKAAVEARHDKVAYDRPHPYDTSLPWESDPLDWFLTTTF